MDPSGESVLFCRGAEGMKVADLPAQGDDLRFPTGFQDQSTRQGSLRSPEGGVGLLVESVRTS